MQRFFLSALTVAIIACSACHRSETDENKTPAATDVATAEMLSEDERGPSVPLERPRQVVYRFSSGDSFGYKIHIVENVLQTRATIEEKNEQEVVYWYALDVVEAYPTGGGRLRATCDRVSFRHTSSDGKDTREMTYDTDAENPHDVEKQFSRFNAPVNTPFEMVVDSDGRIALIDNMDDVIRKYLSDDYATTKSDQLALIQRDYAETSIRSVLQHAFQKLPETPVGIDSSWVVVQSEKFGYLSVRNDGKYTVTDVTNTSHGMLMHIDVRLTSTHTGPRVMDTGQGIATMDTFDVQAVGRTTLNLDKGRIHRRTMKNTVYVKLWVEQPEETKRMFPDEMQDFWWVQDASIVTTVEPWSR